MGKDFEEILFDFLVGCSYHSLFWQNENVKIRSGLEFVLMESNDFVELAPETVTIGCVFPYFFTHYYAEAWVNEIIFAKACHNASTCCGFTGF